MELDLVVEVIPVVGRQQEQWALHARQWIFTG
jgi:hypothetical protein